MRFLLDESADFPLGGFLKDLGHDVTTVSKDYPQSLADRAVLAIAFEEQRILITNDRDFGELIFRQSFPHAGVILFRLGAEDLETKTSWLQHIITDLSDKLDGFLVITDRGVRIRQAGLR